MTPTLGDFQANIYSAVYGDDLVVAVRRTETEFNAINYATIMESLGLEFTTAEKGTISKAYSSIHDISFLKRKFVYHDKLNTIVGVLDDKTREATINWVSDANNINELTMEKLSVYQREAFLHPRYEDLINKMSIRCAQIQFPFIKLSDKYLIELYNSDNEEYVKWSHVVFSY